ncbi:YjdF family protein [Tissierella sp. MSJ-40]|uniref:YjdF family protein n=1 Tax=Tissierella simiarum TaxID=2841534 RepID=A0ABS6EC76_9FIRM|nr:YjdF family protein [Tissierella simiarum]MBU5439824.1 YjdF family protein [Tissierella simiarum]
MSKTVSKLTVFFDEPFWVGVYEREFDCKYEVCKITFGAEPKDYEVYDFMLKNYDKLRFSPSLGASMLAKKRINPKRIQREINKQLQNTGIGTKAQQALKLQQEQGKLERKSRSREQREAEKERQFQLRQEKRKKKHKGR